jgi:hypothetical protein
LNRDTLQQVAEERQLFSRERLLTHEVFVADIQATLHEIAALSADTQLSLQSLQIQFLLHATGSTQKFCGTESLFQSSAVGFHTLESEQRSLTLLFDVELLRTRQEFLCSTIGSIALLLG